jgi:hypothetical protein
MNVGIGNEAEQFNFWKCLFQIVVTVSLQCVVFGQTLKMVVCVQGERAIGAQLVPDFETELNGDSYSTLDTGLSLGWFIGLVVTVQEIIVLL